MIISYYFCIVINNFDLECDYRYKTILSLETKNIPNTIFFITEAILEFFLQSKNIYSALKQAHHAPYLYPNYTCIL